MEILVNIFKCESTSDTTPWLQLCCQSKGVLSEDADARANFTVHKEETKLKDKTNVYSEFTSQSIVATTVEKLILILKPADKKCWQNKHSNRKVKNN